MGLMSIPAFTVFFCLFVFLVGGWAPQQSQLQQTLFWATPHFQIRFKEAIFTLQWWICTFNTSAIQTKV